MKQTRVTKLLLGIGIGALIVGLLMKVSHINYGIEILIVGILTTAVGLILPILANSGEPAPNDHPVTNYPTISQSWGITGIIVVSMLILSPVNLLFENLIGKEATMLLYYLLALGIPFWMVFTLRKSKTKLNSFNFALENKGIIPYIIIGSIALLVGISSPISGLIPMSESIQKAMLNFGSQTGLLAFIILVIAAPVLEELIFRGIILDGLLKIHTPVKSILISSLLFGLVHLNPWQFVTGLIIGSFSGWVYYKTRSLMPSIIIHAAANLCAFTTRFLVDVDAFMDKSLVESYGGLANVILATTGSVIIVSICIFYLKKEFARMEITNGTTQVQATSEPEFSASLTGK